MQKKKLDLNNLLAKYEGYSNHESNQNSRYLQTSKQPRIEEEFYQNKTYQAPVINDKYQDYNKTHEYRQTKSFQGNFTMSKSEVEQFLLSLKDQLKNEERAISLNSEQVIRQLYENFQRSHDKLKKQIVELLDKSFYENERAIKEQLSRQSKIEFPEFMKIYSKISFINKDIDRLLSALKGSQYRKAIAEVVTKDFQVEMTELKTSMASAKVNYLHSLGQVQPDRARIQSIKDNLSKLFYFSKKSQQPHIIIKEESSIFNIFKDKTAPPRNPANDNPPLASQSRTRRSFFNFGGQ